MEKKSAEDKVRSSKPITITAFILAAIFGVLGVPMLLIALLTKLALEGQGSTGANPIAIGPGVVVLLLEILGGTALFFSIWSLISAVLINRGYDWARWCFFAMCILALTLGCGVILFCAGGPMLFQ